MANITTYQDLFYGQWERPDAPNPRLASAISSTETNLVFTSAIKDENGNIPTKAILIGIKDGTSGYIETLYVPKYILTGNITNTSPVVTNISSTSKLAVGMRVTGAGIQANTTIASVDSATQITLNNNATATTTGVSLTFLSLSSDGLKAYGVVRGVALAGTNGIDFETSNTNNRVAHAQDDQVRVNISALLFEMFNKVTNGSISNGNNQIAVGAGSDVDIFYYVNNGDVNKPYFKYDASSNGWYYSNDGISELPMGGAGSLTGGTAIDITAGAINVKYDNSTIKVNGSNQIYSSAVPIGSVLEFAGSSAPTGFLLCDGTAINRITYADLFAIISTTYGVGDGSTTFNLPNIKGKTVVGRDAGQTEFDVLGETGGAKTHTLITAELPAHNHTINDPGHTHSAYYNAGATTVPAEMINGNNGALSSFIINSNTTGITINNTGSGTAHNNLQPYIVMNYIIKY